MYVRIMSDAAIRIHAVQLEGVRRNPCRPLHEPITGVIFVNTRHPAQDMHGARGSAK
jgi:hypothetical protein